jgi:hypothetical protein
MKAAPVQNLERGLFVTQTIERLNDYNLKHP